MAKKQNFLFVTIEGGGNIPPMFGLARRLSDRGHQVRVLTEPCLENTVKSNGFGFIAFEKYFTRTDRKQDIFEDWNASPFSDPSMENVVFGPAKIVVEETVKALKQLPTDVLVVDCLLPTALIAGEYLEIPRVVVFHMPEYMPGANRPPGMMGLLPGKGILGKWRDRLLGNIFSWVLNKHLPLVNEVRSSYGLGKLKNAADLLDQADLRFIQTHKAFDFPIVPGPENVRYTGPVLDDPDWTEHWDNPWQKDDTRPLVVVSFSSTYQNQAAVLQRCMDALKGLNVRGLVTLGLAIDHLAFDVPDNVWVVKSAPHSKVFPLADLVITHAGHGTIMRALAHGLPLLCLPMGRDQNDNAAKVAHFGCGTRLSPKAKPPKIRERLTQMLADPGFKNKAVQLQEGICLDAKKNIAIGELERLATRNTPELVSRQEVV